MRRLAFYIERYGDDLEADFAHWYPSDDLGELWRQGKHRRALNLIDRLPQASWYHRAVANDPEHVDAILAAAEGQPKTDPKPPLNEWTPLNEQVAQLNDSLESLIHVTVRANGGKPGKIRMAPRPHTAFEDRKIIRAEASHKRLVARVNRARGQVE